jgi:PAS domain S-box-containing protein
MSDSQQLLDSPLFQALAELSFDSVMVTEPANDQGVHKVIYVNQGFTDMTGYAAEEVLGQTPGILQGPKTDKALTDRLAEDLSHGRTFHGSTVNYRKDGSPFDIEWKVTPVMRDGCVTRYLAVQRDITGR